jgi:transcriptional regulator with XRE-family HTH domain
MRTSSKRTTVAVLRDLVGLKTPEFARIVGLSLSAIEKLESGRLKLSEEVAIRISQETGVSADWLLEGQTQVPPYTEASVLLNLTTRESLEPYTRDHFEHRRAHRNELLSPLDVTYPPWFAARMAAVMIAAVAADNGRLADYRAEQFLCSMEKTFGKNPGLIRALLDVYGAPNVIEMIFEPAEDDRPFPRSPRTAMETLIAKFGPFESQETKTEERLVEALMTSRQPQTVRTPDLKG